MFKPKSMTSSYTRQYYEQSFPIPRINLVAWTIVSLVTSCTIRMVAHNKVLLNFFAPYTIVMILSCVCLYRGLKLNKWYLLLPWLIATGYMLYAHHIPNIFIAFVRLHSTDNMPIWMLVMWVTYFAAIVDHLMIAVQIVQIAMQRWHIQQLASDVQANNMAANETRNQNGGDESSDFGTNRFDCYRDSLSTL